MKAEALKWENKRLEEAKSRLEAQVRDLQRRLAQREEALAEARSPCKQKRRAQEDEAPAQRTSPRRHEQRHRGQHSSPKVMALSLLRPNSSIPSGQSRSLRSLTVALRVA